MRFLLPFFLAAGFAAGSPTLARAQGEELDLQPPLSEVFPSENGIDGVHVKYPVLVNDHTILRPDAMLRFVYVDQNPGMHAHAGSTGGGDEEWHTHITPTGALPSGTDAVTHGGGAAGGWSKNDSDDTAGIFDDTGKSDTKRQKAEMQSEVWTQKALFDDAFEHAADQGTTVVYTVPTKPQLLTAAFDLPEGMLLGQVDGHVLVLGLKEDSRAYSGGVRPGDQIQSVDGGALKTLEDFQHAYDAARRAAKGGVSSYSMVIFRPAVSQTIPVQIAAPPSIPSFLGP